MVLLVGILAVWRDALLPVGLRSVRAHGRVRHSLAQLVWPIWYRNLLLGLALRVGAMTRLLELVLDQLDVTRQRLVRLPQFMLAVGEGAVVAELAFAFRLEELANLCLVVAVRDVHHLEHELIWERL